MFSARTNWDLSENELAAEVRVARERGADLLDLTVSNPTQCGFSYPANLLAPLSEPDALTYEPAPFGMLKARSAVAAYYRDHGADVEASQICLTTSTSEAYSFLFRLLCDPGDEVLIARPSYPLFDYIAQLDGVRLREFPLLSDESAGSRGSHAWSIDMEALRESITPRTRAVVLVHPNNPTGNFVTNEERSALDALCAQRGLALLVDEVFLDYTVEATEAQTFAKGASESLLFVLSGLSKVCGLPQMKASWIVARGPEALVSSAMARLEMVADTFLSMNAPVQHALPAWLGARENLQQQIQERVRENLEVLDARLAGSQAHRLPVEGGWAVVLRVPRDVDGVPFAEAALARGVLVQPGDFYGMRPGRVVLSLLTPPEDWRRGLARLPLE